MALLMADLHRDAKAFSTLALHNGNVGLSLCGTASARSRTLCLPNRLGAECEHVDQRVSACSCTRLPSVHWYPAALRAGMGSVRAVLVYSHMELTMPSC